MAKTVTKRVAKKTTKVTPKIVPEVVVATEDSAAKKQFREFIDRLKATNPSAYAKNETELLTKLNQL
jgi:hypothetical protein